MWVFLLKQHSLHTKKQPPLAGGCSDCRQPFAYAAKLGHAWGDCEGGRVCPLHVQSLPKWELFREFPFWRFKLSTLCRQLEQPPLAGGCFLDGCHGIRTRVRRGGRPRPPADTDEGRRNGPPGASAPTGWCEISGAVRICGPPGTPSPAGRCGITGAVRRPREGQAPPLRRRVCLGAGQGGMPGRITSGSSPRAPRDP